MPAGAGTGKSGVSRNNVTSLGKFKSFSTVWKYKSKQNIVFVSWADTVDHVSKLTLNNLSLKILRKIFQN